MTTATIQLERSQIDVARIALTGALVAVFDGTFAVAYWVWLLHRTTAIHIFQGIAGALLGKTAIDGGWQTAALGVAMHTGIALGWTIVFVILRNRMSFLERSTRTTGGLAATGAVYGMFIWVMMDLVLVPLTHARPTSPLAPAFIVMLVWHAVGVGFPIVVLTRPRSTSE